MRLGRRGLAAADKAARPGVVRHVVLGDHQTRDDGRDVAAGGLVQSRTPGGQVVDDRWLVQSQPGVVDDVEVSLV